MPGEVVQYTTTPSRVGAYLGPIPHWLYFTPLRSHQPQWSVVVIWSSGIATHTAILGLVVGLWMYSPSKPYR
jgi:prolipoprotein diacylglyceryltransferase